MLTLRPGTTWFLTIRCWHLSLWLRLVMAINNTRQKKMHIEFWILIIKRWQEAMTIELSIEYQSLNIEYWHLNIGDFCITLTIKKLTWSRMMQEEELFQSLKLTPHILMTACLHSWTCLEKAKSSIDWHIWRVWVSCCSFSLLCLVSKLDWSHILQESRNHGTLASPWNRLLLIWWNKIGKISVSHIANCFHMSFLADSCFPCLSSKRGICNSFRRNQTEMVRRH